MSTADTTAIDGTPTNGVNAWIDSLVWGGAWVDTPDLPTSGGPVTISIAAVSGNDPYQVLSGDQPSWTVDGLAALDSALSSWEAVANIEFVVANSNNADVWVWSGTSAAADGALGWSETPSDNSGEPLFTVFNSEDSSWSSSGFQVGGYAYVTVVHELGHLLGLAHPHDGGSALDASVFPGVTSAFGSYGTNNLNQGIFSVMSYNDGWVTQYPDHSAMSYGWDATPMALDIAAIQAIYGANTTYASGSNTYTLPTTNAAGTYWSCVWDTGGTDEISNAGSVNGCIINLNAAPLTGPNAGGYVSYAAGIVGGFTIANNVVLENATGGSGNDTITGNAANNILNGGVGDDSMAGGVGDDTYVVDSLSDVVTEGTLSGTDLVQIAIASAGGSYTVGLNVENATLTNSVVYALTGNRLNNILIGNAADNTLNGEKGSDTMVGGAGDDTYVVDRVDDVVIEGASAGSDLVRVDITTGKGTYTLSSNVENATLMSKVACTLTGNSLDNILTGNAAKNTLNGGDGNDTLIGGAGNDTMVGGAGDDTYVVDSARDVVTEAASAGIDLVQVAISKAGGSYTLGSNVENVALTSTVAFTLTGNALDNTLTGNAANNTLKGGAGNDTLSGGTGNDKLTGGAGSDSFLFDTTPVENLNSDQITDFVVVDDTILLENSIFTSWGNSVGTISSSTYVANVTGQASESNQYLIYETDTGSLYYDADGSGSGTSVSVALLGTNLSLTYVDFMLV